MNGRARDLVAEAWTALGIRRLRTGLTVVGIGIGAAVIVAVLGLSASSRAALVARLDALGTNLLRVSPGSTLFGDEARLPEGAPAAIGRLAGVQSAAAVVEVGATVRRTDLISELETGGLAVVATGAELRRALELAVVEGAFLDGREHLPAAVLGSTAARRLGIHHLGAAPRVDVGGEWFGVVGILAPTPLTPEVDRAVLIGPAVAAELFGTGRAPTTVYVRARPEAMGAVADLVARAANPLAPNEVAVVRPSDALEARAAVDASLARLLLALGGVVVLVGTIGVMNVMLTSVLERRSEIGIRRALGATRADVAGQFLAESSLLAGSGGVLGLALGAAATVVGASRSGWVVDLPATVALATVAGAVVVGALAGLQPAWRAARLDPAVAVRGR